MGKTTVKPISLGYRDVGSSGNYRMLMGVLKGLTIGQDEPEATEIEAEFYDSPFDIFYDGNPVTMTFELANYTLDELPDLFGGAYEQVDDEYDGEANVYTSEHEWKLDFSRGYASLVLYRGLTIGTIKKDADGALNFSVTITALIYEDGDESHMYKIVGAPLPPPEPEIVSVNNVENGGNSFAVISSNWYPIVVNVPVSVVGAASVKINNVSVDAIGETSGTSGDVTDKTTFYFRPTAYTTVTSVKVTTVGGDVLTATFGS